MAIRPADIVSPISDHMLSPRVSADEARRQGHVAYEKPTPEKAVMLFIDHQIVLQNFWNNANQHVVPDPFGTVK